MPLRKVVQQYIKAHGLTIDDMTRRVDMSGETFDDYKHKADWNPKASMLIRLARVMNISTDYLIQKMV